MTAFARCDEKTAKAELNWEIRTVNHRHLDISLHIPEELNAYEIKLKDIVKQNLGRGRVDLKLTVVQTVKQEKETIQINKTKAQALLDASEAVKLISPQSKTPTVLEILQWSGVIEVESNPSDEYSDAAQKLLEVTLKELIKMRENEGARLLVMITSRCDNVIKIVEMVKARRGEVIKTLREKVLNKIAEIEVSVDENRLEQELVYQAQRLDVDEELDRLIAHIEEVNAVLKRDEPIGRRLDFLMQELNRETNTLASKSNDAETTKSAVDLKVLIEQMREQCLNIE